MENNLERINTKALIFALLMIMLAGGLHASTFSDAAVSWLASKGLSPRLIVLIISMLPLIELRGSIPVGIILFKMPWIEAVSLSIVGNMIPIPFILIFVEWFFRMVSRVPLGARFTAWMFARTRQKGKALEKYEALGLTTFVGIPLPGTGGWTGALAARIFGISFWKSMLYILIGVSLASAIVTPLSMMGKMVVN